MAAKCGEAIRCKECCKQGTGFCPLMRHGNFGYTTKK